MRGGTVHYTQIAINHNVSIRKTFLIIIVVRLFAQDQLVLKTKVSMQGLQLNININVDIDIEHAVYREQ